MKRVIESEGTTMTKACAQYALPSAAVFAALGTHYALHIDTFSGVVGPASPLWWFFAAGCVALGASRRWSLPCEIAIVVGAIGTVLLAMVETLLILLTIIGGLGAIVARRLAPVIPYRSTCFSWSSSCGRA